MNDRQRELIEALDSLGPGEAIPAHLRYDPTPTQQLVDQWTTELLDLEWRRIDPASPLLTHAERQRRGELMDYLTHAGEEHA